MSTKITIDNHSGSIAIDGVIKSLPAPTSVGSTVISDSSNQWVENAQSLSWRNKIINGDMRVTQRGTGAVTADSTFAVDRWAVYNTTSATFSAQQSSVAPAGFSNSYLFTVGTGASATAAQYAQIQHKIEGLNIYDLAFGTASAKTITLSFWVRSSVTGTFCVGLRNWLPDRSYVTTYSILSANTWEKKTITIAGDTGGIWHTDNRAALRVTYDFGSGGDIQTSTLNAWQTGNYYSTSSRANLIGTSSATFYLTGVQLETGSAATPFEMLQYEKQLELCQRYFARLSSLSGNYVGFGTGCSTGTNIALVYVKYPQQMRGTPTMTQSNCAIYNTTARAVTALSAAYYGSDSLSINVTTASSTQTMGQGVVLTGNNNAAAYIDLNAEL